MAEKSFKILVLKRHKGFVGQKRAMLISPFFLINANYGNANLNAFSSKHMNILTSHVKGFVKFSRYLSR